MRVIQSAIISFTFVLQKYLLY